MKIYNTKISIYRDQVIVSWPVRGTEIDIFLEAKRIAKEGYLWIDHGFPEETREYYPPSTIKKITWQLGEPVEE